MASIPGPDRGSHIVAVSIVMTILSTMALTLRVWSRLISKNNRFWWDDWLAIASLVCAAGYPDHQLHSSQLRSSRLTDLSKALRAWHDIHSTLMGLRWAWPSHKSTCAKTTCFRSPVFLRCELPLRLRYLTTKILGSLLLHSGPQNEVDPLPYRCVSSIGARHCMASLRYLFNSISLHAYTKRLAPVNTRTL